MDIRGLLNRHRVIGFLAMGPVIALVLLLWGRTFSGSGSVARPPMRAFFTIDDGETWFADDIDKMPPFEHDGKTAVRVRVFTDGGNAPFAGYLERVNPDAKAQLEAQAKSRGTSWLESEALFLEVKRARSPEAPWVSAMAHPDYMDVKCAQPSKLPPRAVSP